MTRWTARDAAVAMAARGLHAPVHRRVALRVDLDVDAAAGRRVTQGVVPYVQPELGRELAKQRKPTIRDHGSAVLHRSSFALLEP